MGTDYAIETVHLDYAYGGDAPALTNVSVTFPKGSMTAILGANGCGKSTLLKNIAGILTPDAGSITVLGKDRQDYTKREFARRLSVVHQKNTAPQDMLVSSLVRMGRTPYRTYFQGGDTQTDHDRVEEALRLTGLTADRDKPVGHLSGGEMQRVWLAMALAQDTDILLLDEITTYLDIRYQTEMLALVQDLNRQQLKTIVMVLHDINLALKFSDYVLFLKKGRVLAEGALHEVMRPEIISEAYEIPARLVRVEHDIYCIY